MSPSKWFIYGFGGLGAETMDILRDYLQARNIQACHCAFVDDKTGVDNVLGYPVFSLSNCESGNMTIAVGEPAIREKLMQKVRLTPLTLASVFAPSAVISGSAEIDDGVIIAPLCSIQARARIEENVAVNTMAIVGHDVVVKSNAVISSMVNLGGAVTVGEASYIGMGAMIKEGVRIGSNTIIGMGSVVYQDIPDDVIAVGNPARVSRRNEDRRVFK